MDDRQEPPEELDARLRAALAPPSSAVARVLRGAVEGRATSGTRRRVAAAALAAAPVPVLVLVLVLVLAALLLLARPSPAPSPPAVMTIANVGGVVSVEDAAGARLLIHAAGAEPEPAVAHILILKGDVR